MIINLVQYNTVDDKGDSADDKEIKGNKTK